MSFFKVIVVVLAIVFCSCEDTKKSSQQTNAVQKDTVSKKISTPKKKAQPQSNKTKEPKKKITQENVKEFLTAYGKENPETKVKVKTRLGNIIIKLNKDTPLHRANFLYLAEQGYFEDTFFHRIVPKFIIQGGNSDNYSTNKKRFQLGQDYLVPAEIKHKFVYGSVAGAKDYRENPKKMSVPFEFFIFLGQPVAKRHLDNNYTVFGQVIEGMDIVQKIANEPAAEDEWPKENVVISVEIID